MGKGHRHMKHLKAEKAKVKLKAKKSANKLPKGLNVTDTSFKVKKILIREQLQQRDETEVLSIRKLNIKDLLARLQHHNSTVREEALKQLKEILLRYPPRDLHAHLNPLLRGVAALSLDKEKDVRRDSLNALSLILRPISKERLTPYCDILISYLSCAMTHINPNVKEDSLLLLDVLAQNCGSALAKNSHKILPNFLGMICRLHSDIKPGRQLTTTLNSKNTSAKWRIKVLERLANIFTSLVYHEKHRRSTGSNALQKTGAVKGYARYVPVYGSRSTQVGEVDFDKDPSSMASCAEGILPMGEFAKHVDLLMPLISDIWLEVCPDGRTESNTETTISSEAATLLTSIVEIVLSITEYVDMLEHDHDAERTRHWFRDAFCNAYMKNFLSRFPYGKMRQLNNPRRRQEDFSQAQLTEKCLQQNLALCRIHVWFVSVVKRNKQFSKTARDHCESILRYLDDVIVNWHDSSALPQLTELLRALFLKAGPVLNANGVDLSNTLRLILKASSRLSKKEAQSRLSLILGDIMLEYNLNELHR
ncbi:Testis-expressed sequence 10 protein-like protein [Ooceraea biroi]|uniref:Testis-expressed sequence 10 protein-like protein n=2 Tax=Ooceraea biroi TaxID=2015173 RepID=A0A026VT17_OOCBI|nr:Testis-expressed sequence 10 protein-like protein [Ooceraea biroi]